MKVLLLGSSIIKNWNDIHIADHKIINKGVSGLLTKSLISCNYQNKIFGEKNVTDIIVYCGGNDILSFIHTTDILKNIELFIQELRNKYKYSRIIILSIIKSPIAYKNNLIDRIMYANKNLKKMISNLDNVFYLEIGNKLNNSLFFKKDNLHLNKFGYEMLNTKINLFFDEEKYQYIDIK